MWRTSLSSKRCDPAAPAQAFALEKVISMSRRRVIRDVYHSIDSIAKKKKNGGRIKGEQEIVGRKIHTSVNSHCLCSGGRVGGCEWAPEVTAGA